MKKDGAAFPNRLLRFLPARSASGGWPRNRSFGLKAKIAFFIVLNVAGVLFLFSYLDFHLARKDQIDLFRDRNLYIAKQIDASIPDPRNANNLRRISEEMEEWLLSRPSLMEIDLFLFSNRGVESVVSTSKLTGHHRELLLSEDQLKRLRKEAILSSVRETEEEQLIEAIVPFHSGKKVIGGIRVASSLDEAQSYLGKKKTRAIVLTFLSIFIILLTLTLLFRKLVGNPIQKLVAAMARAEQGYLETEVVIPSKDELGELGRNFNQMLRTIRETHEQNAQLLAQVNRFNEDLTRKIEAATSELAKRNEELKLLNEALFESQRQLGHSEKLAALGQVAATIAHQVGTPLNTISGYIQLMLKDGNLEQRDQDRLKTIESQLDRLTDSVKNLLSFTRQPKPELRLLNVNGLLEELIHLSEPWLFARNVRLSASLAASLPSILGDPTHLQTLFLNLISNALDAMPRGGKLTVRTRNHSCETFEEPGPRVEILISDTGIGITEESKKRIFDPFYTTKKIGEGTGLGLAICSQIIKEHLGRLDFESEVGKGSAFTISIPAVPEEEPHDACVGPAAGRG